MSYVPLLHVATGDLATAALHNTLLDNVAWIEAGGIAIPSQAAGDVIYAPSATQHGRVNGTGILKLNGSGAPTVIGAPGFTQQAAKATAAAAASITISGLDLATDGAYEFIIQTSAASVVGFLSAQVNGAAGSSVDGYELAQVLGGVLTGATQGLSQALVALTASVTSKVFSARLLVTKGNGGRPSMQFHVSADDVAGTRGSWVGSAWRNDATNMTSIKFALSAGTCDWVVWTNRVAS